MSELLEELDQKRQYNNNEAEKHRRLRDELNEETKRWVQKRDELNAKVRELVEEAAKRRQTRDSLNVQVREAKEQRDIWNKKVNELNEAVTNLKKTNLPREGPPIAKLKKELKALEFKQMTSVLTVEKERELIEQLSEMQKLIKEREKALEANDEVRNAIRSLREGDVVGEHLVSFAGPGECLELAHRATDRDVFSLGALEAAARLRGRPPGNLSLSVLILGGPSDPA